MSRLHGKIRPRLTGLPHLADQVTRLGGLSHISCKQNQIKIRNYSERRVTPPRQVTSPTWCPPRPCKQTLKAETHDATNRCDKSLRHVAATRRCNKSPHMTCENHCLCDRIFFAAICRMNSNWFEFVRRIAATK